MAKRGESVDAEASFGPAALRAAISRQSHQSAIVADTLAQSPRGATVAEIAARLVRERKSSREKSPQVARFWLTVFEFLGRAHHASGSGLWFLSERQNTFQETANDMQTDDRQTAVP